MCSVHTARGGIGVEWGEIGGWGLEVGGCTVKHWRSELNVNVARFAPLVPCPMLRR